MHEIGKQGNQLTSKNGTNPLETINIILELKNKLVSLNLALSKLCNNLKSFLNKIRFCLAWPLTSWNLTKKRPKTYPRIKN